MVDLYLKLVTHWDEPSKALLGGNDQLLTDYSSNEELGKFDNVREHDANGFNYFFA